MIEISGEIARAGSLLERNLKLEARSGGEGELGFIGLLIPGARTHYRVLHEVMNNYGVRYYLCKSEGTDEAMDGKYFFCMVTRKDDENAAMLNAWLALTEANVCARELAMQDASSGERFADFKRANEGRDVQTWYRGLELEDASFASGSISDESQGVHFERLFPKIVERLTIRDIWFKELEWLVMILDISQDYDEMVPLMRIIQHNYRMDLRTSAWVVNKMLKLVTFYPYHKLEMQNFLIGPERHELVYLDWSKSYCSDRISAYISADNVRKIAWMAMHLIDAKLDRESEEGYSYDYELQPGEERYLKALVNMSKVRGEYASYYALTYSMQERFCDLVEEIWGLEFCPARLYSIERRPKTELLS